MLATILPNVVINQHKNSLPTPHRGRQIQENYANLTDTHLRALFFGS